MSIDRPAILRNAEKLLRQGKVEQAAAEYARVVDEQPGDWNTANVLGDLYVRAGHTGKAVDQFIRIADHLHAQGFLPKAAAVYKKVLKLEPDHEHAKLQAADIAGGQGLTADARAHLNPILERRRARGDSRGVAEIVVRLAGLDPNDFGARMAGAHARLELDDRPGAVRDLKQLAAYLQEKERRDEALQALHEAARVDPDDAEVQAMLAERDAPVEAGAAPDPQGDDPAGRDTPPAAAGDADESRELLAAAEAHLREGDRASAIAILQECVTRIPTCVPALERLVDACAEGGFDSMLHDAKSQLADAYLSAGAGRQAIGVAEDLIAREPWERANVDRFRQALLLLGEPDPDAIIAERLSGTKPFTSTDTGAESLEASGGAAAVERLASVEAAAAPAVTDAPAAAVAAVQFEAAEIDLSTALDGVRHAGGADVDGMASSLLEEKGARPAADADEEYRQGLSLFEAGRSEEAIEPLRAAVRAPKLRFASASLLGRIFRSRGDIAQAIEWLERAAQVPAPSAAQGHLLLFDLADALEHGGETARALAVCMELQADAGNYRDVAARIDRLANVRARG